MTQAATDSRFVEVKLRKGYRLVVGFKAGKPTYQEGPWTGAIDLDLALDNIQKFENQGEIQDAAGIPRQPPRIHAMERFRKAEEERRMTEAARIETIAAAAARRAVEAFFDEKKADEADNKKPKRRNVRRPPADRAVAGSETR